MNSELITTNNNNNNNNNNNPHPPTHPAHPLFGSQIKKRVPPKRGTGPHRCVYTNPPTPTQSDSGPRASKEDKLNPIRTYVAQKR